MLRSSGQYYYGSRTANVRHKRLPEQDLWVCYFSSSITIKQIISEHGKDAFDAEVIYTSTSADDVYWHEQKLIKDHIHDINCFNKKYQDYESGDTIFSTTGKRPWNKGVPSKFKGVPRPPEVTEKIKTNRKGKGLGIPSPLKGIARTEESKSNQRDKMVGRYVGELNPFFGKTHTPENKAKTSAMMSLFHKGRAKPRIDCPHCGQSVTANTLPAHVKSKHIKLDA